MIQYTLKCDNDHRSESWFQSADAFDALARAGHLTCPVCGSTEVVKALMAPRVIKGGDKVPKADAGALTGEALPAWNAPEGEAEKALAALRKKVEENSDYVGTRFAQEARAMHLGDAPARAIHGEARPDQAKELIEDGVPVMPLPFRPKQKLT